MNSTLKGYYPANLKQWLSVNLLAGDYPWISPYAHCLWNPVKFIDLDGRDWYEADDYVRKDGKKRPPEAALAHELGHAENDMNGTSVKYNTKKANGEIGPPRRTGN